MAFNSCLAKVHIITIRCIPAVFGEGTVISTTTKIGNVLIRYVMLSALMLCISVGFYMYYRASGSCRVLESISRDPVLNKSIKEGLVEFLGRNEVQTFLLKASGSVFSISDFGVQFPGIEVFEKVGIHGQNLQLVIGASSSESSFRPPYSIEEVGIGYSRAYLMYVNGSEPPTEGFGNIELSNSSYVDCRVYH